MTVFGESYAAAYDAIYAEKDYAAEVDAIAGILERDGGEVRTVLDLGAGTGRHTTLLAQRGYEVVAVDRSPEMLAHAERRAAGDGVADRVRIVRSDIAALDAGVVADAAVMLFAVLGYHTTDDEVLGALHAVRRHLRPGGLLIFDVWYGPAVIAERPEDRSVTTQLDGGRLERDSSGTLDVEAQTITVDFRLRRYEDEGAEPVERWEESHAMRFFFPRELGLCLRTCGFELVRTGSFPQIDAPPGEADWTVGVVARAA